VDLAALASLQPEHLRALLPGYLAGYIDDPDRRTRNVERMTARVRTWSDATCEELLVRLQELGSQERLYDPHPEARGLSRDWMRDVINDVQVQGLENVREVDGPIVVIANHLSYIDSTAVDCALAWSGDHQIADSLVSIAGPKVYQDTFRRIATSCIATLPVPQSASVATEEAAVSMRELARRAVRSIRAAHALVLAGRRLLIFAEGSRSRDGRLGPFLSGVHRYLDVDGAFVVPLAIVGTQDLMPVGQDRLRPGRLSLTFGSPIPVGGQPREVLGVAHQSLAELLPSDQRPE